ncbi:hypothetical protein MN116_005960 [Schistosoma mekongi]|uniref:Sm domain-containing protein n=1 Tax=Schistosoma mekongi TaxID=38744 RepID=A0AAE1ZAP1_SCHME|nr:hypothetical protein MN116_005960 [Schistosoma mekongi]
MTLREPSFENKDEAKNFLRRLCDKQIIVHVSDGRRYVGSFWCTDNVGNIVMGSCVEYLANSDPVPNNLQRHLSTIVISGP